MNNKQDLAIQLEEINYNYNRDPQHNSISDVGNSQKINQAGDNSDSAHSMTAHEKKPKKKKYSTPREASINLFKGYIGSGILALPYAFDQVGYLLSTVVFLIVAAAIYYTMGLLFKIADKNAKPGEGYVELAKRLLGAKGLLTIKLMLVIFQVGCCVSYVIFFIKFFEHAFGTTSEDTLDDMLYLALALAIILPMSVINDISVFAKASIMGNIFVVSTLILIFITDFIQMTESKHFERNVEDLANFSRIPMIIGVSIYAFEAVGLVFSIRNSLEDTGKFTAIFRNINILICVLYTVFASCGVIAYGHDMNEIILFSLDGDKIYIKLFQISYAVALILSYPLQLLPSLHIIEDHRKLKQYIKMGEPGWRLRQFWSRFGVTMIICWSAYFIPRFAVFLNMVGSIAGTALQFFFPILMYNKMFAGEISKKTQILNKTILIFGAIGGFCGFIFSVEELFNEKIDD